MAATAFKVLTYNLLHSVGAARLLRGRATASAGPWVNERLQKIAEQIRRLSPDVACLQEVDGAAEAALVRTLGDEFESAALYRNEELPPKDGCAIFVRKSKFEVLERSGFRLRDTVGTHFPQSSEVRGRAVGFASALWRELHEKLNLGVVVKLRARGLEDAVSALQPEVWIATTHLFWNPKYPDLKLLQAYLLSKELEKLCGTDAVVLAGDLNSTPFTESVFGTAGLSGVYQLLVEGEVPLTNPHHPVVLRRTRGILLGVDPEDVPQFKVLPFKSAYKEYFGSEGPITNASQEFRGCLDYIFYKGAQGKPQEALQLLGALPLPSAQDLQPHIPLPSPDYPSDHLPLMADFKLAHSS